VPELFDTTSSTNDGPTPSCGGGTAPNDIWYTYTASCTGTATATLCGSSFDTRLAVYADAVCPAAVEIACNDDLCGLQSQVSWCSEAGQAYFILVHGFGDDEGTFELTLSEDGATCDNPPSCALCPGEGDCCVANETPGCNDETCCSTVCACDSFCCDVIWDIDCADGSGPFGVDGCNGLELCVPAEGDRRLVDQVIFEELTQGIVRAGSRALFVRIIEALAREGCDAVALSCTEIPLLVPPEASPLPTLDSTRLLARAAVAVALGSEPLPSWRGGPFPG